MLKTKKIISYFVFILGLSVIAGSLHHIGNVILKNNVAINPNSAYLYRGTYLNSILAALVVCVPAYFVYCIFFVITKIEKGKLVVNILISISSFAIIVFLFSSLAPFGVDFSSPYVKKNMVIFFITALIMPICEIKIINRYL